MKPIRLITHKLTKTSLTTAVLMGSAILCNQAYAVQDNLFLDSLPKSDNADAFLVIDEQVELLKSQEQANTTKPTLDTTAKQAPAVQTKPKFDIGPTITASEIDAEAKVAPKTETKASVEDSSATIETFKKTANIQASANRNNNDYLVAGQAVDVKSSDNSNDDVIKNMQKSTKSVKKLTLSAYAKKVNAAVWKPDMKKNTAMTVKLQTLLDWNHASPGPIDGGWGMNSKKALKNFQAMKGLKQTARMNQETWNALIKDIPKDQPVFINHKISKEDVDYKYTKIPRTYPEKFKLKALNYQSIQEKIAEQYHMNIRYLKKLNKGKKFVKGETITVLNPGKKFKAKITKVVADKKNKTLYAYSGKKLIATYPTTVGSADTPSPHGTFKIANRVLKPHYKATVEKEGEPKKTYLLKPGPNSPVGIVWMGLSKPSFGIHGSPIPEGISRQASHGCVRLTNWDALELRSNIKVGATVVLK